MTKKNIVGALNIEKDKVADLINPHLIKVNKETNAGKQKSQELIDIGKFITASKLNIRILDADFEIPDFLIEWDGMLYGLEHTEIIDQKKKLIFEKNEWLVKQIEKSFLERYGEVYKHFSLSLKFDLIEITNREKKELLKTIPSEYKNLIIDEQKLFSLFYPGRLTKDDIKLLIIDLSDLCYLTYKNGIEEIDSTIVNYVSMYSSRTTLFTRSESWSAGSISELIIAAVKEKEAKIGTYIKNTNGLKQCLFLLIQGSNRYSDYSFFDDRMLENIPSAFDKIIVFNFFKNDFFILK